jgi:uncharacterized RDD family membrane protein YckC
MESIKMSDTSGFSGARHSPRLPPRLAASSDQLPDRAFSGVRTRRIFALLFDLIFVSILSMALWLGLLVITFGLSIFFLAFLPPIFPLVAFFYNGLTISGWRMATPGMKLLDLEVRMTDGSQVPFINAAVHAILFYISTMIPPIFLVSLLSRDKRCLHDIVADIVIIRRDRN